MQHPWTQENLLGWLQPPQQIIVDGCLHEKDFLSGKLTVVKPYNQPMLPGSERLLLSQWEPGKTVTIDFDKIVAQQQPPNNLSFAHVQTSQVGNGPLTPEVWHVEPADHGSLFEPVAEVETGADPDYPSHHIHYAKLRPGLFPHLQESLYLRVRVHHNIEKTWLLSEEAAPLGPINRALSAWKPGTTVKREVPFPQQEQDSDHFSSIVIGDMYSEIIRQQQHLQWRDEVFVRCVDQPRHGLPLLRQQIVFPQYQCQLDLWWSDNSYDCPVIRRITIMDTGRTMSKDFNGTLYVRDVQ